MCALMGSQRVRWPLQVQLAAAANGSSRMIDIRRLASADIMPVGRVDARYINQIVTVRHRSKRPKHDLENLVLLLASVTILRVRRVKTSI